MTMWCHVQVGGGGSKAERSHNKGRKSGMSIFILLFILCFCINCSCFVRVPRTARRSFHDGGLRCSSATVLRASSPSSKVLGLLNCQTFTYTAGSLGLTAILLNRLAILDLSVSDFQSRLDLIATMAASALLLNALTQQEIETRERDSITLVGYSCTKTLVNPSLDVSSQQSE